MNTTAHFEGKLFAYPLGNYIEILPQEIRICGVQDYLQELWSKCKEKQHGKSENIKLFIGKELYSNRRIFDQYINGSRVPTLQFVNVFFDYCRSLGIKVDCKKIQGKKFKFGHGGNAATANLPLILTPKLAYLVGAMRDGTLALCGKYEISYSQKNKEWLYFIRSLIKEIFSPSNEPKIAQENRVTLSNRPIFEFLHNVFEIPIGDKLHWLTPSIIKEAPFIFQKYYIRGFYDADGLSELGFCQANYQVLEELKVMLEKNGIKCCSICTRFSEGKHDMHVMLISRKNENHIKFMKTIGCSNKSKAKYFIPFRP